MGAPLVDFGDGLPPAIVPIPKGGLKRASRQMSLRLDPDCFEVLNWWAHHHGISLASLVRASLENVAVLIVEDYDPVFNQSNIGRDVLHRYLAEQFDVFPTKD